MFWKKQNNISWHSVNEWFTSKWLFVQLNFARSFVCDDTNCGMKFQRRLHLERHLASHSKAEDKVKFEIV